MQSSSNIRKGNDDVSGGEHKNSCLELVVSSALDLFGLISKRLCNNFEVDRLNKDLSADNMLKRSVLHLIRLNIFLILSNILIFLDFKKKIEF